ncbi:uncharacterized protein LOC131848103 [Achroia grisella]|uniref:uncharacterized protein LOC131848103 n=1 Tax=Achroia grisella TaxID=688607 RepID=UPI0027D2AC15|nr:uncharacterized protein LOC131848103 [Achroia grisella]
MKYRLYLVQSQNNIFAHKNFVNGLHNARNILHNLEQCIRKTNHYEERLLRCRADHCHSHTNELLNNEPSEKLFKTGTKQTSRSQVDLAESWSTMSIVCLQYQYEELSKRYEALLQAYNDRCTAVNIRDTSIERLQCRTKEMHKQLTHAHKVLLVVGEKFLTLKRKCHMQKNKYKDTIELLKCAVKNVVRSTERARLVLEQQLKVCMAAEHNAHTSLLLAEIRKYNILYLENLRLKAFIEQLMPGRIVWNN